MNFLRIILKSTQKESLFVIALLFLFVSVFEFLPAVKEARRYVSEENFENFKLSCKALLSDRPWYGRINHWFFAWIVLTPALVFSVSPRARSWLRGGRAIFAALLCYAFLNLAVHLQWDIRNAPFSWHSYPPGTESGYRMDCINIGDGFSLVFALTMGWIPAFFYTTICLMAWEFYYLRISKIIGQEYKRDRISRVFYFCCNIFSIAVLVILLEIAARQFFGVKLLGPYLSSALYYLTLRPLLIPFEIFVY